MKKFQWHLQRVLDVRRKQEQKNVVELLQLTEHLASVRSELLIKQKALNKIIDDLSDGDKRKSLAEQEFFLANSDTTNRQIKQLKEMISRLEIQQKEKIQEVIEIRRFREALEKMREEAKTRFFMEQEKLEQKLIDEAATTLFIRNSCI